MSCPGMPRRGRVTKVRNARGENAMHRVAICRVAICRVAVLLCVLGVSPPAVWAEAGGSNVSAPVGWRAKLSDCWCSCRDYLAAIPDRGRACLRRWAATCDRGSEASAPRRVGLVFPKKLDAKEPLVVLVHGLDAGPAYWCDLAPLLEASGHRVARFGYPNDQALDDSAALLADEIASLARKHPGIKLDLVAHSMGALIARRYVEGANYRGGVRRLIMLAPPNEGSCYARFSQAAELVEHAQLWRTEPDWNWTWLISDGVGEARRDLSPGSRFLTDLNARPRRRGVRYTIVAGNRSCGWRYTASAMRWAVCWLPDVRYCRSAQQTIDHWAAKVEGQTGKTDGLVWLTSTRLPGVDDYVVLPADHTTLTCSRGGRPPVAWQVIEARLK